jgi:hypothetical protein
MFLNCLAQMDQKSVIRCGLPAEVRRRFIMCSTDGALESVMIRCPAGHYFNGSIEFLIWESTGKHDPCDARLVSRAQRGSLQRGHYDRAPDGRSPSGIPTKPAPKILRPNTAPVYYLGHPADLWITVMRQRRISVTSTARRTNQASPSNPVPLASST